MISKIVFGAAATAALMFTAQSGAIAKSHADEASGLPFCTAKVKDRCIQKSDVKAAKAAAKAG